MENTNIKMKNIPIEVELSKIDKNLMVTFKGDVYQSYVSNLNDREYSHYLKEIKALFKDLDDIYRDINNKFKLKNI